MASIMLMLHSSSTFTGSGNLVKMTPILSCLQLFSLTGAIFFFSSKAVWLWNFINRYDGNQNLDCSVIMADMAYFSD